LNCPDSSQKIVFNRSFAKKLKPFVAPPLLAALGTSVQRYEQKFKPPNNWWKK